MIAWRCSLWMVYLVVIPMAPALWVLIHRPHFAGVARGKVSLYESFPPGCDNEVGLSSESWKYRLERQWSPSKRPSGLKWPLDIAIKLPSSFHIPGHKYLCLLKTVCSVRIVYHLPEKLCFSWKYCEASHIWLPGWQNQGSHSEKMEGSLAHLLLLGRWSCDWSAFLLWMEKDFPKGTNPIKQSS